MVDANPSLELSIEGHTDNTGDAAQNRSLSADRARAVADALVALGVVPGRLQSQGFGQDRPVADNATAEGRAQNRRLELVRLEQRVPAATHVLPLWNRSEERRLGKQSVSRCQHQGPPVT